jgi:hypothetical protein
MLRMPQHIVNNYDSLSLSIRIKFFRLIVGFRAAVSHLFLRLDVRRKQHF